MGAGVCSAAMARQRGHWRPARASRTVVRRSSECEDCVCRCGSTLIRSSVQCSVDFDCHDRTGNLITYDDRPPMDPWRWAVRLGSRCARSRRVRRPRRAPAAPCLRRALPAPDIASARARAVAEVSSPWPAAGWHGAVSRVMGGWSANVSARNLSIRGQVIPRELFWASGVRTGALGRGV